MFRKSYFLKILFLMAFLAGWPAVTTYSAMHLPNHPLGTTTTDGEIMGAAPSMVFAQNQAGNTQNEPLGEIVSFNTKKEGQSATVSIKSSQPVQYTAFKLKNPLRLVLDFPKMDQGIMTRRIQVDEGIIDSIRPIHFKEAGVLRLEILLNRPADYEIKKPEKNKIIIRLQSSESVSDQEMVQASPPEVKGGATAQMAEASEESKDPCYPMLLGKKDPVSLDFQNADVRNLFRIFSEVSGFNIILSPEVGGSVNIRMIDVPWNQAMEVILSNSALGRECVGGNIVRIATKAVLEAESKARADEKKRVIAEKEAESNAKIAEKVAARNAQDLVTEVVRVDNADIAELAANITTLKSSRPKSQVTVDTRTNTLILTDLPESVAKMLETIKVLDVPTAQVLIEAKIVEISKSFTQELGVQWGLTGELRPGKQGNVELSGSGSVRGDPNFLVDLTQTTNVAAGSIGGFDLLLGGLLKGSDINIRLEALETEGKGRILSSPRVTTADNKEARIQSGRKIPYQVTSAEGNSIAFVDADLRLTVVPHVTSDNNVYMVIDATNNDADFNRLVGTVPTITTNETHTEVLVPNGDTTVLGGIYKSNSTESKKEVPFFSKIPFLGLLFKSFADSDTINELLVFITPTIIETN